VVPKVRDVSGYRRPSEWVDAPQAMPGSSQSLFRIVLVNRSLERRTERQPLALAPPGLDRQPQWVHPP
jgi:hypothetical protein